MLSHCIYINTDINFKIKSIQRHRRTSTIKMIYAKINCISSNYCSINRTNNRDIVHIQSKYIRRGISHHIFISDLLKVKFLSISHKVLGESTKNKYNIDIYGQQ